MGNKRAGWRVRRESVTYSCEEAIRGKNLDAVLVTRLAGIRDKDVYERPDEKNENMTFFTYYDSLEQTSSGNAAQYRVITLVTNVYETGSGGLVWSMQSEIVEPSRPRTAIVDQIQLTIDSLKAQGLIGN